MARKPYHHGDLRAAALAAARVLVETEGADAVTMRAVAKAAGVDHRAIYRHFEDRERLLSAVAADGYRDLLVAVQEAGPSDLIAVMTAHIRFAMTRTRLHQLMLTRSRAQITALEALDTAVRDLLRALMQVARAELGPEVDDETARNFVFAGLSASYGLVSLAASMTLKPRARDEQEAFLIARVTEVIEGQRLRFKSGQAG